MRPAPTTPITTERLTLVPATVELLRADAAGPARLGALLGAEIPASWPQELYGEALQHLETWLKPADVEQGWGVWYVLVRAKTRPTLIGTCGFKGSPDAEGMVEVGYGIVVGHLRRGYATEATRALIAHAFHRGARTVQAHTFDSLVASIGVLRNCGFQEAGPGTEQVSEEERRKFGTLILFRLEPADV